MNPLILQVDEAKRRISVDTNFDEQINLADETTKNRTRLCATFDAVFSQQAAQKEVYQQVESIIQALLKGYNGTVGR